MPGSADLPVSSDLAAMSPADVRALVRSGTHTGSTAGVAHGFAQANLVILPADVAAEFEAFCRANPQPCPLIDQTTPGDPVPRWAAPNSDLRTDLPRYRVFRDGVADQQERSEVSDLWRDDFVAFLIGCSYTFDTVLLNAGLPVRHAEEGRIVPMYRTSIACEPAGRFRGPMIVSMRPYAKEHIDEVIELTAGYPAMHGAPVQVGDPAAIGIADVSRPDFGDAVTIHAGEQPVFWACGVTPQAALAAARPEIAITHSPGHMFVTDLRCEEFATR